jgi:ATP-dependent Clp protease ATP-binding subunit ClpB
LTDSQGHVVNYTNTIIIMTSNLGAEHIEPAETEEDAQRMIQGIMQAVRGHFRPEFLNRLDDILVFSQLSPEVMPIIVDIQLRKLRELLQERQIQLDVQEEAKMLLAEEGYNPLYGARPLKRVIQARLQDHLAEEIISGALQEDQTVVVTAVEGEFVFQTDGGPESVATDQQVEPADVDQPSLEQENDDSSLEG